MEVEVEVRAEAKLSGVRTTATPRSAAVRACVAREGGEATPASETTSTSTCAPVSVPSSCAFFIRPVRRFENATPRFFRSAMGSMAILRFRWLTHCGAPCCAVSAVAAPPPPFPSAALHSISVALVLVSVLPSSRTPVLDSVSVPALVPVDITVDTSVGITVGTTVSVLCAVDSSAPRRFVPPTHHRPLAGVHAPGTGTGSSVWAGTNCRTSGSAGMGGCVAHCSPRGTRNEGSTPTSAGTGFAHCGGTSPAPMLGTTRRASASCAMRRGGRRNVFALGTRGGGRSLAVERSGFCIPASDG